MVDREDVEKAFMVGFKVLSQHLRGGSEEKQIYNLI
jgi:hypothetical protein